MNKIFCFDIESCDGGSVGSLCSLGYVIAEGEQLLQKRDILVNPACGFNPMLLSGKWLKLQYPKKTYRASPTFDRYYDEIKELISNSTVVGFSVANDVKYLNDACMYYGLDFIDYEFYDVQTLLSLHLNERRSYSLTDAAGIYGVSFLPHSSADDAEASYKVLRGILASEGLSLKQFIQKYQITAGSSKSGVIYPCRSPLPPTATITNSKTAIAKLNVEFLRSVKKGKGELSGKRFCFSEEVELCPDFRSILWAVYAKGGEYTNELRQAHAFIYGEPLGKRYDVAVNCKKRLMNITEFLQMLGGYQRLSFDDEQILLDRRAREQRERIEEYLSSNK